MAKFTKDTQCRNCRMKLPLFHLLTDEELEIVDEARYEVGFNKGETIFKQGGPLTHIACITEGMAKVYLEGTKHKNIIIEVVRAGELIGGPGFQVDNRHHFSVSAITDARACFIDALAFEQLIKTNNPFATGFIKHLNLATIQLFSKIQTLTQKQMHGRIADTLLYLAQVIYGTDTFETTLSRQDLADMSAMTKESAIRIMKDMKDEGIIDFEGNNFRIVNEKQLTSISATG